MKPIQAEEKGLFLVSDPGAAKGVLAYVLELISQGCNTYKIISDRTHSFYSDFELEIEIISKEKIEEVINYHSPNYLFTGTSYTSSFELEGLTLAQSMEITSYSFVDHWTSFLKRFNMNGSNVFPSHVLVIDERAESLAVKAGIPGEIIAVFGNPYYRYLENWSPKTSKFDFIHSHGLPDQEVKIVTFLPEPLSNVGGKGKYGIDEYESLAILFEALHFNLDHELLLLIKPHPNQDLTVMREAAVKLKDEFGVDFNIIEGEVNTVISHSNIVIGMFSNALIEAKVLGISVIRILAGLKVVDPLDGLNVGTVIYSTEELISSLRKQLYT